MVDFQSRDTSRGLGEDESTDDAAAESEASGGGEPTSGSDDDDSATVESGGQVTTPSAAERETDQDAGGEPAAESAPDQVSVALLVTDEAGAGAADAIGTALDGEHEVLGRDTRTGDLDSIQSAVDTFLDQPTIDVVVTVGGVGVGPGEVTVDVVEPLLDTTLPGFGELFRRRHAEAVGSATLRSRALAGIADGSPVFCLPAESDAARSATGEILVPELSALVASASEQ